MLQYAKIAQALTIVLVTLTAGCNSNTMKKKDQNMPTQTIQEVQEKYTDQWMALPGVVGTGIGEHQGAPCIKVFVQKKTPDLVKAIPDSADGYRVVLEATGEFRALEKD